MSYSFQFFLDEKQKIVNYLLSEYKSIQTGVATPQVLDLISVDVYGSRMPISHLASISVESATNLLISPYDKATSKDIEKSINEANLSLSVSSDSAGIRVFFSKPTTESRQKMVKIIGEKLEDARVKIRKLREDIKKDIEKKAQNSEISKDDEKIFLDNLQDFVLKANNELESFYHKKEKDIINI